MLCKAIPTHTATLIADDNKLGHFDATLNDKHLSVWADPKIIKPYKQIKVCLSHGVSFTVPVSEVKCNRAMLVEPDSLEFVLS